MKGSFLIKAKDANVITERGVRAFIIERLLNSPFSRGAVFNVDDRTIQVQLEGDEKQVNAFIQNLEKEIIARFGNPALSFTQFEENSALEVQTNALKPGACCRPVAERNKRAVGYSCDIENAAC